MGEVVAAVRLPDLRGALGRQIAVVEAEFGASLSELFFEDKRRAVQLLEQRGAFTVRKGVEQVACERSAGVAIDAHRNSR